jgi:hypothetical protein
MIQLIISRGLEDFQTSINNIEIIIETKRMKRDYSYKNSLVFETHTELAQTNKKFLNKNYEELSFIANKVLIS